MQTGEICEFLFDEIRLTYRKFGHGPAVLLAFHGFGQTGDVYAPLEKYLGNRFTILAIDLFGHGGSVWQNNVPIPCTTWVQVLDAFLSAQAINRFSLMGFSLGGRFALATVKSFASRIDQLILIAPDGITRNGWYRLATGSVPGRSLFRWAMNHLTMLSLLGHWLTKLGMLNRTLMRFVDISLGTEAQRQLVYKSWTTFRFIRAHMPTVARILRKEAVQVFFFVGAYDRIVPATHIIPLTNRLPVYTLTVLQTGHNHLISMAAEQLGNEAFTAAPSE